MKLWPANDSHNNVHSAHECVCRLWWCMLRGVWVIARCLPVCGKAIYSDRPTMGWGNVAGKLCARRTRAFSLCMRTHFLLYVSAHHPMYLLWPPNECTHTRSWTKRHAVVRLRELELSSRKWITHPYTEAVLDSRSIDGITFVKNACAQIKIVLKYCSVVVVSGI